MNKRRVSKNLSDEEVQELVKFYPPTDKYSQNGSSPTSLLNKIQIDVKCKSENQKKLIKSIRDHEITICEGMAGCGKTYLSCYEALKLLKSEYPKYNRIILVKSVTTLKDEEVGFLKGDLKDKLLPIMYSFTGNFEKLIGKDLLEKLTNSGLIEQQPLAYVRGVSIDNAIVIIDECQNISVDNMKTILTRIGYDSKYIVLGDSKQIDIKNKKNSSLEKIMKGFEPHDGFGIVRLGKEDIVRHRLISIIDDVFNDIEKESDKK